jgi:hypothetical protein
MNSRRCLKIDRNTGNDAYMWKVSTLGVIVASRSKAGFGPDDNGIPQNMDSGGIPINVEFRSAYFL